jgi:hypothetical protein
MPVSLPQTGVLLYLLLSLDPAIRDCGFSGLSRTPYRRFS